MKDEILGIQGTGASHPLGSPEYLIELADTLAGLAQQIEAQLDLPTQEPAIVSTEQVDVWRKVDQQVGDLQQLIAADPELNQLSNIPKGDVKGWASKLLDDPKTTPELRHLAQALITGDSAQALSGALDEHYEQAFSKYFEVLNALVEARVFEEQEEGGLGYLQGLGTQGETAAVSFNLLWKSLTLGSAFGRGASLVHRQSLLSQVRRGIAKLEAALADSKVSFPDGVQDELEAKLKRLQAFETAESKELRNAWIEVGAVSGESGAQVAKFSLKMGEFLEELHKPAEAGKSVAEAASSVASPGAGAIQILGVTGCALAVVVAGIEVKNAQEAVTLHKKWEERTTRRMVFHDPAKMTAHLKAMEKRYAKRLVEGNPAFQRLIRSELPGIEGDAQAFKQALIAKYAPDASSPLSDRQLLERISDVLRKEGIYIKEHLPTGQNIAELQNPKVLAAMQAQHAKSKEALNSETRRGLKALVESKQKIERKFFKASRTQKIMGLFIAVAALVVTAALVFFAPPAFFLLIGIGLTALSIVTLCAYGSYIAANKPALTRQLPKRIARGWNRTKLALRELKVAKHNRKLASSPREAELSFLEQAVQQARAQGVQIDDATLVRLNEVGINIKAADIDTALKQLSEKQEKLQKAKKQVTDSELKVKELEKRVEELSVPIRKAGMADYLNQMDRAENLSSEELELRKEFMQDMPGHLVQLFEEGYLDNQTKHFLKEQMNIDFEKLYAQAQKQSADAAGFREKLQSTMQDFFTLSAQELTVLMKLQERSGMLAMEEPAT